jgi:Glycosyl hydrolases family 43
MATVTGGGTTSLGTYKVEMKKTLIPTVYTADPSARVFNGKLIVYCSHDIEVANATADDSQFGMTDYRVFGFSDDLSEVTDHGNVLPLASVPWAGKQMWAPDAVCVGEKYYLYFPAKDNKGVFRIGVATADSPYGPFKAEPTYIAGSYSIDPVVFVDDDGSAYMVFGGDWGGQLQNWPNNTYDASAPRPTSGPALRPRVAKLASNMREFDGPVKEMSVVDSQGKELQAMDQARRFFEGAWVHKRKGVYYLSYSTGETHKIVYATSHSPTGPWTYAGEVLSPPDGWTSQVSIVDYKNKTYLFYHDAKASGKTPLRNVKMQELKYKADGSIISMTP